MIRNVPSNKKLFYICSWFDLFDEDILSNK